MATPPRRRRKKWLKLLLAVVVLCAIGAIVYLNLEKEEEVPTYASVRVKRGTLVDKLAETGSIELVRTVEIKSTISGRIRELPVEAGDVVVAGQLVAIIEPDPNQTLQMMQARSSVERAELTLEEQERDVTRKRSLSQHGMLSAKDMEEAEMRLTRALNDLRLAGLELEVLETKADPNRTGHATGRGETDDVRVLASIDGIIINRGVEIGEVVASGLSAFSGGTVLFEIGDPSRMIVSADIAEIDISKLQVDQHVDVIVDAYPDTTYRGRVRWIAPVGVRGQGSPIVTFDTEIDILDRDSRLRQGMSCDIDIIFTRRDSTLYLPIETVSEVFDTDDDDEDEEIKGRRGRFHAYVVRPPESDSTAVDSGAATVNADGISSEADTTMTEDAAADSAATAAGPDDDPPEAPLDHFVEVELQIGLETTTRIEILSDLDAGDRVAANPDLIRRKLEEEAQAAKSADAEEEGEEE